MIETDGYPLLNLKLFYLKIKLIIMWLLDVDVEAEADLPYTDVDALMC